MQIHDPTRADPIELGPSEQADGSVIWLHGLGADGHDFEAIVPALGLPPNLNLRFIFPHAPIRPVTLNGGMEMRAWFDILSLDRDGPVDEAGILKSVALLAGLVEREHERGVSYSNIVVAGFSQGGAIASHFAIQFPERLGGLMALSTYLPLRSRLLADVMSEDTTQPKSLRIFMAHGSSDPMLPIQLGESSRDALTSLGFSVTWIEYDMPHSVSPQEIVDISRWLVGCYGDAKI